MDYSSSPAVAAIDRTGLSAPSDINGQDGNRGATPSTPAEAAGRGGNLSLYPGEADIEGLRPYRGWTLRTFADSFDKAPGRSGISGYLIRSDEEVRLLNCSRFSFRPTQERFEFLARHDFPIGLAHDAAIDAAMQVEANVIAHALAKGGRA